MYQLRRKKILPIVLPSMVEDENFSDHPRTNNSNTRSEMAIRWLD